MENVLLAGFGEVGRHDWIAVVWRVLRWFVVDFKINFWRNIGFVRASEDNLALRLTPATSLFSRGDYGPGIQSGRDRPVCRTILACAIFNTVYSLISRLLELEMQDLFFT